MNDDNPITNRWQYGKVFIYRRADGKFYGTLNEDDASRASIVRLRKLLDEVLADTEERAEAKS